MMTDRDIWAIAANILDVHGDHIDAYLVGMIEQMNIAGNDEGLALWLAISEHIARLLDVPDSPDDLN